MAGLVDIGFSNGLDINNDESLLRNALSTATAEGGVYAVDPSSSAADSLGTYKYTAIRTIQPDDLVNGWFCVSRGSVPSLVDGPFRFTAQLQILCSAENGTIVAGDLLVPVPGKNYLVRADSSLLASRRPIAKAVRGTTSTTAVLVWCYFFGMDRTLGSAGGSGSFLVDTSMDYLSNSRDILQSCMDMSGGEYETNGATTWIYLPQFFVERRQMEGSCSIDQYIFIDTLIATTQTVASNLATGGLEIELMMNGVATGSMGVGVGATSAFTLTTTGGNFAAGLLEPKFVFRYGPRLTGQLECHIFTSWREGINNGQGVTTAQNRYTKLVSDHFSYATSGSGYNGSHLDGISFSWRIRQAAVVAGNRIWAKSFGARYAAKRTGG